MVLEKFLFAILSQCFVCMTREIKLPTNQNYQEDILLAQKYSGMTGMTP